MACTCQVVVTSIYWLVLHEEIIKTVQKTELYILCYTSHILPFIYLTFDYFLNNIILQPKKALSRIDLFVLSYTSLLAFLELDYELNFYSTLF